MGTWGSRSTAIGGTAVARAARKIRDKARKITAHQPEVSEDGLGWDIDLFKVEGVLEQTRAICRMDCRSKL